MSKKLTELTQVTDAGDGTLFYLVDPNRATGDKSVGMDKNEVAGLIGTTATADSPIENIYPDIATMLADQSNQTTQFIQVVEDDGLGAEAYYEKLATSTASLVDYRVLSANEILIVTGRAGYRTFRIDDIQDDAVPLTSVRGGRISFEYSGTDVTAILFNAIYSDAIVEIYGTDVNFIFYNQSTSKYEVGAIASGAWTTVNTDYYRGALTGAEIQIADLTANDRLEFFISQASSGGGGGGLPITQKTGTNIVFTEDAFYNESTYLTSGDLTFDLTGAVIGATTWIYCNKYIPTITTDNYKITGNLSALSLNVLKCTYDGNEVQLTVVKKTYLDTPIINIDVASTELTLRSYAVNNAESYTILFNTVNDEGTASPVPSYNGTDTTYTHTGLTNGTTYYYYIIASGKGYFDSLTGTNNSAPAAPNTAIGSMGVTYPTAASLATFLGITEGDITSFNVGAGDDITCDINVNYTLPNQAFFNNTTITSYLDRDGLCNAVTGTDHFRGCSSLIYIDMRGDISPDIFANNAMEYCNLPNNTGSIFTRGCDAMAFLNAPLATTGRPYSFNAVRGLQSLYLPSLTTMSYSNFFDSMLNNPLIVEAPLVLDADGTRWFYTATNANNLLLLEGATSFGGTASALREWAGEIYIPNVSTNIGGTNADSTTFSLCAATTKIYCNTNLQTNNGGGIDGDLAFIQGRGGTVVFITDTTPPSAVTDLAVTNIGTTTAELTLTTPASTNTIIGYDVYINRNQADGDHFRLLDRIAVSGDTINVLLSGNVHDVKIKTVDEFRNRSGFSNEVTFTTL